MSKRRNNRRLMSGEGEWTYRCSLCREYKKENQFHSDNSKPPFNLAYNCKECRKEAKERPPMLLDWEIELGNKWLQSIGYDIKQDIHKQFVDKVKDKYGVSIME